MDTFFWDLGHDFFWGASFMNDCDEILSETQRDILDWVSENIVHHVSKSIDKFVAANWKSFLLIFKVLGLDLLCATTGADHFVQGDQWVNTL